MNFLNRHISQILHIKLDNKFIFFILSVLQSVIQHSSLLPRQPKQHRAFAAYNTPLLYLLHQECDKSPEGGWKLNEISLHAPCVCVNVLIMPVYYA